MKSNFTSILPHILKHEGGYVNHPDDPGGATNKGVTIGTFRSFIDPNGTIEDLKNITDEQVATVYRQQYWDKVRGDELPSGVDYAVFDFAVNSGPNRAARYLQQIVGVTQDGAIGPITLAAVSRADAADVINTLCDMRLTFMRQIRGGALWRTFGRGWQRRVDDVRAVSLGMVTNHADNIFGEDDFDFVSPEVAQAIVTPPIQITWPDEDRTKISESTTIRAQQHQWAGAAIGFVPGVWAAFQAQDTRVQIALIAAIGVSVAIVFWTGRHIITERIDKWMKGVR